MKNGINILKKQIKIDGQFLPVGSICFYDAPKQTVYICPKFPNYKGNGYNVRLNCVYKDMLANTDGHCILEKCYIAQQLYKAWCDMKRPKAEKVVKPDNFEKMMAHDRKKKKGSGGVRLSSYSDAQINEPPKWREVTVHAHWVGMPASMVGNACRYR